MRRLVSDDCGNYGLCADADLQWDGVSQWAALQGLAEPDKDRVVYIATAGGGASLRQGDWKLIAAKNRKPELFNVVADPFEKFDLAASSPQIVERLKGLLEIERSKDRKELPADLVGVPK
ncbi:MAG: hypothetical protein QM775_16055 [Pirellulales bacterium]